MAVQHLKTCPVLNVPDTAGLVTTSSDDLVALGVKGNLTNFVFVALKQRNAGTSEDIVNSRQAVSTSSRQLISSTVKACVQNLVIVASEGLNALS